MIGNFASPEINCRIKLKIKDTSKEPYLKWKKDKVSGGGQH